MRLAFPTIIPRYVKIGFFKVPSMNVARVRQLATGSNIFEESSFFDFYIFSFFTIVSSQCANLIGIFIGVKIIDFE